MSVDDYKRFCKIIELLDGAEENTLVAVKVYIDTTLEELLKNGNNTENR